MGTLKIEFYDEAIVSGKNVYGKLRGSAEDASTSSSIEAFTVTGGSLVMAVTAISGAHYFNPNSTDASTASNGDVFCDGFTSDDSATLTVIGV